MHGRIPRQEHIHSPPVHALGFAAIRRPRAGVGSLGVDRLDVPSHRFAAQRKQWTAGRCRHETRRPAFMGPTKASMAEVSCRVADGPTGHNADGHLRPGTTARAALHRRRARVVCVAIRQHGNRAAPGPRPSVCPWNWSLLGPSSLRPPRRWIWPLIPRLRAGLRAPPHACPSPGPCIRKAWRRSRCNRISRSVADSLWPTGALFSPPAPSLPPPCD